jgi:hypothetical protein
MKPVMFGVGLSTSRLVPIVACAFMLAGCETDGIGPTPADGPRATVSSSRPDADTTTAHVSRPGEPAQDAEPMTRTRAARECWMRTEKSSARDNLDKRAELVNKCIDEKMRTTGAAPPKT